MQILSKTVQIDRVKYATAPFKFFTVELLNSRERVTVISQTNFINSPVIVLPPMWNWMDSLVSYYN